MTSKQRAYLRSLGHVLPAAVQMGKEGVSEALIQSMTEVLSKRELLKVHVLKTCACTPKEAADAVAQALGADVVQVIGRKFLLYLPNEKLLEKGEGIVLP